MTVKYQLNSGVSDKIERVANVGKLSGHADSVYIRLDSGIEMFLPDSTLDWYSVERSSNECQK